MTRGDIMSYVNISEFIIYIRKQNGLTQKELGDQLSVTSQAVSKWERGENFPDTEMLLRMSRIYDVSVDDLLRGKKNSVTSSKSNLLEIRFLLAAILMIFSGGYYYFSGVEKPMDYLVIIGTLILGSVIMYMSIKNKKSRNITIDNVSKGTYVIALIVFLVFGLYFGVFYISWLAFPFAYAILMIFHIKGDEMK